ncbi:transforming growth factor beta receptor type 3-like [Acipenser ruthenus]|uniref:transforming growth factor beta receptor type 3-like n=1 Tax=Acipenser ruthenus TaxID=7906 RepID=UPI0027410534|nr:transforming growth factor beta receptor type 3-like [Acipenser ruthenus]
MAGSQAVSAVLFAFWCVTAAGPLPRSGCVQAPVSESHPVRALLESFTVLSGCASRGTTSLPQEVHIINLRSPGEGPSQHQREVTLHVKPISSLMTHHKALVFMLNSPQPMEWKLKTEKLLPGVQRTFYVSEGSMVHFQSGNFSASAVQHQEKLPQGNKHLLVWAQKKYGAVTSFTEVKVARNIYIKVGEDPVFPANCTIEKNFLSLNYLAEYLQPKPAQGCLLSSLGEQKEVHIIELQAPNSNPYSAFQVDIIVDIRPLKPDSTLFRDLVLILKCEKSVNWVIRAHGIIGKLDVLTSDSAGIDKHSRESALITTAKLDLPSSAEALIKWVNDHGYGPVTTYTNAPVANRFHVRLEETVVGEEVAHMIPTELEMLRDHNPQPGLRSQDGFGFPFPFGRERYDRVDEMMRPPHASLPFGDDIRKMLEPEKVQGSLNVGLSVQCEDHRMVVAVDKESLQANGYRGTDLTLQDPSCKATENTTHYILETSLTGCDTTPFPFPSGSRVVYINSIMINQSYPGEGSGLLSDFEDMEESEDNGYSVDAEENVDALPDSVRNGLKTILFNCTYGKPTIPEGPPFRPGVANNNVTFSMEFYNTALFLSPVQALYMAVENRQVFVEVSVTKTDQELGFAIQTCFISPSSLPNERSDYIIIENICPKDESVVFYDPQTMDFTEPHEQMGKKRFSFVFKPKYNTSLLFLHCELTLCTKKEVDSKGLLKCIPPDEACTAVNGDMIIQMFKHRKTTTKPLVVVSDKGRTTDIIKEDPIKEADKSPQPSYVMHGLDTATVVGIAFAAFVIGALLTGALWFIYVNTGETARRQQVPTSPPASENSSAAHSIGSTQSTPCSSNSTA